MVRSSARWRVLMAIALFATIGSTGPRALAQYTHSRRSEDYRAAWVTQSGYPTLERNQCAQFSIQFRNVGRATWYKREVNLGTDRPRDRIPGFIREDRCSKPGEPSGWLSSNRVAMREQSVSPGGVATFLFWYTVPPDHQGGTIREYFRLVADGITWMEDCGCFWDVRVVIPPDSATNRSPGAPRSVDEAISWARSQIGSTGWPRLTCLQFVRTAYGFTSSFPNVHDAIQVAQRKNLLRRGSPAEAPRGGWLLWRWDDFGHVSIRTDGASAVHALTLRGTSHAVVREENADLNLGGNSSFAGWVQPGDLRSLLGLR
jgi:hypothetical protein